MKILKVFFFHARLTRMRKLVTFGELNNDVDTTGTGSSAPLAIFQGAHRFANCIWRSNFLMHMTT
jgi:hypothetical protein